MMTYTMDHHEPHDPNGPTGTNMDEQYQPSPSAAATAATSSRREPERGVKKTPSLRRGAAVYAELLQSAVMASIQAQQEADEAVIIPPLLASDKEEHPHDGHRRNKRTSHESEMRQCPALRRKSNQSHDSSTPSSDQQSDLDASGNF